MWGAFPVRFPGRPGSSSHHGHHQPSWQPNGLVSGDSGWRHASGSGPNGSVDHHDIQVLSSGGDRRSSGRTSSVAESVAWSSPSRKANIRSKSKDKEKGKEKDKKIKSKRKAYSKLSTANLKKLPKDDTNIKKWRKSVASSSSGSSAPRSETDAGTAYSESPGSLRYGRNGHVSPYPQYQELDTDQLIQELGSSLNLSSGSQHDDSDSDIDIWTHDSWAEPGTNGKSGNEYQSGINYYPSGRSRTASLGSSGGSARLSAVYRDNLEEDDVFAGPGKPQAGLSKRWSTPSSIASSSLTEELASFSSRTFPIYGPGGIPNAHPRDAYYASLGTHSEFDGHSTGTWDEHSSASWDDGNQPPTETPHHIRPPAWDILSSITEEVQTPTLPTPPAKLPKAKAKSSKKEKKAAEKAAKKEAEKAAKKAAKKKLTAKKTSSKKSKTDSVKSWAANVPKTRNTSHTRNEQHLLPRVYEEEDDSTAPWHLETASHLSDEEQSLLFPTDTPSFKSAQYHHHAHKYRPHKSSTMPDPLATPTAPRFFLDSDGSPPLLPLGHPASPPHGPSTPPRSSPLHLPANYWHTPPSWYKNDSNTNATATATGAVHTPSPSVSASLSSDPFAASPASFTSSPSDVYDESYDDEDEDEDAVSSASDASSGVTTGASQSVVSSLSPASTRMSWAGKRTRAASSTSVGSAQSSHSASANAERKLAYKEQCGLSIEKRSSRFVNVRRNPLGDAEVESVVGRELILTRALDEEDDDDDGYCNEVWGGIPVRVATWRWPQTWREEKPKSEKRKTMAW